MLFECIVFQIISCTIAEIVLHPQLLAKMEAALCGQTAVLCDCYPHSWVWLPEVCGARGARRENRGAGVPYCHLSE